MKIALLILSASAKGFLGVLFLFAFSFFSVHFFKLLLLGWEYQKRRDEPAPVKKDELPPPEPKPPVAPQPVYYVVERKRRKKPPSYK